ncbi:MAG: 6-bladed beta-propeller, partial [Gemmatimonadaceae bacterium]
MNFWSLRTGNRRKVVRATIALAFAVPVLAQPTGAQEYRAIPGLRIQTTSVTNPAQIGSVSSVVRLSNGIMVIADNSNLQLHFFTPNGRYIRSAGRDGVGPGEFKTVRWIGECARDTVFAFDYMQNRISVFGSDGQLARTFSTPNAQTVLARCSLDGTMAYVTSGDFVGTTSRGVVQTYSPVGKLLFRTRELLL